MTDTAKDLRNAAARLKVTVREMLAPMPANPSPERVKLEDRMRDIELAVMAYDQERAHGKA